MQIFDSKLASYWSKDPFRNTTVLARATLHDVIKQLIIKMYHEQTNVNDNTKIIINEKIKNGGFKCDNFHLSNCLFNHFFHNFTVEKFLCVIHCPLSFS